MTRESPASLFTRRSALIGSVALLGTVATAMAPPRLEAQRFQPRKAQRRSDRRIDVRQFGAKGNGRTDDRPAIQAAIDSLAGSGGGTLFFPAGVYAVSRTDKAAVAISLRSGVTLEGIGRGSILRLRDGSGGHLVNVTGEANCSIRTMVLDGNRLKQPSVGHAFRSGGVDGLRLEELVVLNAYHYGIGLEAGANRGVLIRNVEIADCGGDGIDIKNKKNANSTIEIANVSVRRWGLRKDVETQAGIDCRGQVHLRDIRISSPGAEDAIGLRMRHGEAGSPHGLGAHHSRLEKFSVQMGRGRAQIGIDVVARSVTLSNGTISGGFRGLAVHASGFRADGVHVSDCTDTGILLDAHGSALDADSAVLSNCSASNCGGDGIQIESDDVQVLNCTSTGNGRHGLSVKETANRAAVSGGHYSSNRSGAFSDRGRDSRLAHSAN